MDRSEARRIVEANIEPLMRAVGVPHWHVTVGYDLRESRGELSTNGTCTWQVDYNRARIELDPEAFDDEAELLEVLRHELFHIVLAPFTAFLNVVRPLVRDDETKEAMLESLWTHVTEKAVINLRRFWIGTQEYHAVKKTAAKPKPSKPTKSPLKMPAKGTKKGGGQRGGKGC